MENMNEMLQNIGKELKSHIDKMPKDKIQAIQWADNWLEDSKKELSKSGLNTFEIIGMLDCLKLHFSNQRNDVIESLDNLKDRLKNEKSKK